MISKLFSLNFGRLSWFKSIFIDTFLSVESNSKFLWGIHYLLAAHSSLYKPQLKLGRN